jgi:ubiquinone/menaquinone biosynthesis C-methylase UbiE
MKTKIITNNESTFYDNWANKVNVEDVLVKDIFRATTAPENREIEKFLGDVKGKDILEIGCGFGEASVYLAMKGARVTASDISKIMVNFVKRLAKYNKVEMEVCQASAEKLPFKDNSFDVVYAANVLHHVDILATIMEVKRVLKKGGKFVCWDPLKDNPLINIYRQKAKSVRTVCEHPLSWSEVQTIQNSFTIAKIRCTWFFTLWIFVKYFVFDRIDPNKERYWKKVIYDSKKYKNTYLKLEKIDNIILRLCPFLQRYCWNVVIMAEK